MELQEAIPLGGVKVEQNAVVYHQGMTVGFVAYGDFYVDIDRFRGLVGTAIRRA